MIVTRTPFRVDQEIGELSLEFRLPPNGKMNACLPLYAKALSAANLAMMLPRTSTKYSPSFSYASFTSEAGRHDC